MNTSQAQAVTPGFRDAGGSKGITNSTPSKIKVRLTALLVLAVVLYLGTVPLFQSDFIVYLIMRILILALTALSFNLLLGYAGLLSFGQAAFYAVGGYTNALILVHFGTDISISLLGGALMGGLLAIVVGFFCVKRTKIYFSMLTLAFGMLVYFVLYKWKSLTGGTESLGGIPRSSFLGLINLEPLGVYYYFVLGIVAISVLLLYRVVCSPFGLMIQGIRDNENRTLFVGIHVKRYRLYAFVLAGGFAALAGGLYACLEKTMFPSLADWQSSAEPIMVTLLGGTTHFIGPIVGSFLFVLIKEIVVRFTEEWLLVFGCLLVIILLTSRGGIVGFFLERLGGASVRSAATKDRGV